MKKVRIFSLLIGIVLLSCSAYANKSTQAMVVRSAHIKAKASFSAANLKQVGLGYQVVVLARQGGWVQIQGVQDKYRGWLRSYQLRSNIDKKAFQSVQTQKSGNVVANFARDTSSLLNSPKKRNSGSVVATIGIRGLSEQELKQAKPNPAELKKMQSYASNKNKARQFARKGQLKVVR